jgi:hypothetical protein
VEETAAFLTAEGLLACRRCAPTGQPIETGEGKAECDFCHRPVAVPPSLARLQALARHLRYVGFAARLDFAGSPLVRLAYRPPRYVAIEALPDGGFAVHMVDEGGRRPPPTLVADAQGVVEHAHRLERRLGRAERLGGGALAAAVLPVATPPAHRSATPPRRREGKPAGRALSFVLRLAVGPCERHRPPPS